MTGADVVVTGLGATTPLGGDVQSTWTALLEGRSGVRFLGHDWATELPVRIAAPLAQEPAAMFERTRARRLDRIEQIALIAARQAWSDAALEDASVDGDRLAVVFGSGGGIITQFAQHATLKDRGPRRVNPFTIPMFMPNGPAAWISLELGAHAGAHSPMSACATGAESIAYGLDLIRSGRADVVLAGGGDAGIHEVNIAAFAALRALSTRNDEPQRASRPFDKARDGFVLGEGGAALVLERADHARARGVEVYARLAGAGLSSDAYDIVQPDPTGGGAAKAITWAIHGAGIGPGDVSFVNAHATSTAIGDLAELAALRRALGTDQVVTAPKSMTGHLISGSGALEALITVLSIRYHQVPPTINLDDPDNEVDMDIVSGDARPMDIDAAISNSFGFGGHNVALAFTRPT